MTINEIDKLANEYVANKAMMDEIAAINDQIKAKIIEAMNNNDTLFTNGHKITNKPCQMIKFDSKAFSKYDPKTYNSFCECIKYNRFIIS